MSIVAVGLDLVDVKRVERLLERDPTRAMTRLLTAEERRYCASMTNAAQHVAARIAAKEATYKALASGTAKQYVAWREVEVCRGSDGKPALRLHGRARVYAESRAVAGTLVSLSHTETVAAAVVVLVGDDERRAVRPPGASADQASAPS